MPLAEKQFFRRVRAFTNAAFRAFPRVFSRVLFASSRLGRASAFRVNPVEFPRCLRGGHMTVPRRVTRRPARGFPRASASRSWSSRPDTLCRSARGFSPGGRRASSDFPPHRARRTNVDPRGACSRSRFDARVTEGVPSRAPVPRRDPIARASTARARRRRRARARARASPGGARSSDRRRRRTLTLCCSFYRARGAAMGNAFARTRAFSKKSRDRASRARRVVGVDPTPRDHTSRFMRATGGQLGRGP